MKKPIRNAIIIVVLISLLSSCSKKQDERRIVVEQFLSAYQSLDSNVGQYILFARNEDAIEFNGIQGILAKRMTFSIGKVEEGENKDLVEVTIKTVDIRYILENILSNLDETATSESILTDLYEQAESPKARMRDFIIRVPIYQDGDMYKVVLTSELSNALFGGYNEYLSELTGGDQVEQEN